MRSGLTTPGDNLADQFQSVIQAASGGSDIYLRLVNHAGASLDPNDHMTFDASTLTGYTDVNEGPERQLCGPLGANENAFA